MRVSYWPNEPTVQGAPFLQSGARTAFQYLLASGQIQHLAVFSYRQIGMDFEAAAHAHLVSSAPDIIFVQHVTQARLPHGFWSRLRHRFPHITIVYHDEDPYDRRIKRIDRDMKDMLAVSDLVLVSGLGDLFAQYRALTSAQLRYLPHSFDTERFASADPAATQKTAQVVMIANRGTRRLLRSLYLPGGRNRARLAQRLTAHYGYDFALYGTGWHNLPSARGPVPFDQQQAAIQSGRISVNWDHFDTLPYYSSDRLPIALAAGVPHVTSHHPGYQFLFPDCPGLYALKTVDELVDCVHWLLSRPADELAAKGLAARDWITAHYQSRHVYAQAMALALETQRQRQGGP